jgi:hypothetical protein
LERTSQEIVFDIQGCEAKVDQISNVVGLERSDAGSRE